MNENRAESTSDSVSSASVAADTGAMVLVREYVARDSRGERLGVSHWFRDAVDWPDEPGYDEITVIAGYDVGSAEVAGDTARIQVRYTRLGRIETGERDSRFVADTGQETQQFVVARGGTRWRIVEPQINQHVSAERVLEVIPLADDQRETLRRLRASP